MPCPTWRMRPPGWSVRWPRWPRPRASSLLVHAKPVLEQVERGAHDRLGVDAVVLEEVVDVTRLAEVRHAERGQGYRAHRAEERQRVRMPVEHRDERGRAVLGQELVQDP